MHFVSFVRYIVKPIYQHRVVVKENESFVLRCQTRNPGQLMFKKKKKSRLLKGIQGSTCKGMVGEGSHRVCDGLMHNSLIG